MNNAPAFGTALKDDGEDAAKWLVQACERPPAQHDGSVGAQRFEVDHFETKRPHCACIGSVAFQVAVVSLLPASSNLSAGCEDQLLASHIAIHEGRNVSAVPRLALIVEEGSYRLSIGCAERRGHRRAGYRACDESAGQGEEKALRHVSRMIRAI